MSILNPSNTSAGTHTGLQFSDQEPNDAVPLLLRPSYAISKSLILDEQRKFRISLKWCALDHSTPTGKSISYLTFIFFTILIPVLTAVSIETPATSSHPISFNKLVQIPLSSLSLLAFFTLARFFNQYSLRHLLFLDGLEDDPQFVSRRYSRQLDKAFRYLASILLPSFFVELAHKIIFFSTVRISLPFINSSGFPLNSIMFVLVLASWIYRTGVLLLVCVLFRLTCELQILRFEGVYKMFEGCELGTDLIFNEHMRIKKELSVTSHRYRFFIIACYVMITISQLGSLLLVLAFKSDKTFFNSGDLVICSVVQLSGFFLCLLGAARITHRAQGIVSIATRWHMMVTSASTRSNHEKCLNVPDSESDSDSESDKTSPKSAADSSQIFVSNASEDPSSTFQTRQAFVAYLQHNHGGITLFGFALDRGLLHTLFAFEFSLVLWILSKVVVLS